MPERDQFDDFLLHCASDFEVHDRLPKTPETFEPVHCSECGTEVLAAFRFCSNCGVPNRANDNASSLYRLPVRQIGQLFEVTITAITHDSNTGEESLGKDSTSEFEQSYRHSDAVDEEDENEAEVPAIEVGLRITNRTDHRIAVSLTFAQSVLVDATGRQLLPLEREENDPDGFLERWFYLYPKAFVDGSLLFPEATSFIRQCYISCQPQDREEELFQFVLR